MLGAMKRKSARSPASRPSSGSAELGGRVALVTGAGVRVGRAIAEELGRAGATVAVHYARSESGARATESAIVAKGGKAAVFQADLRESEAATSLVRDTIKWAGRLDLLICSAAAFDRRPFEFIDESAWRDMLALNLEAPFRLAQAAAPALRRRSGAIVNILDVAAFHAWKGYAHYAAAKAGLAMVTRVLALELAPRVRVCGVAPGTVAFPPGYPAADRQRVLAAIPLQRAGKPSDVAQAVRYLCSASYVTGSVLCVDGGRMAGSRGIL